MNGGFSLAMSIGAVIASGRTTYLSFFDARYTLTATIASVAGQVQTSSSRSGDGPLDVTYRTFFTPTFILSNRGTRPLVMTNVALTKSSDTAACVATEEVRQPFGEQQPLILEPGTVSDFRFEFGTGPMTNDFEKRSELWCLQFTLIDHRGERIEPLLKAVDVDFTLTPVVEDGVEQAPNLTAEVDFSRQPETVAQSGLLSIF
ncbi:MAG: hypothetical protein AAFZ06_03960 [Pseudomonadota bacterium]